MKLWILMGACSSDPDAYRGHDVLPGRTVEWQVSDAPSGQRSYSEDYIDPIDVIAMKSSLQSPIEDASNIEFVFASHQERAAFFKAVMMRMSGVPVSDLDLHPGSDFFLDEDSDVPAFGTDLISRGLDALQSAGAQAGDLAMDKRELSDLPSP